MKNLTKFTAMLLVAIMLFGGCSRGDDNGNDTTPEGGSQTTLDTTADDGSAERDTTAPETTAADDGLLDVVENGTTGYTIFRPESADQMTIDLAVELRTAISEKTGVDLPLKSDWYKPGEEPGDDAKEILVGLVDRKAVGEIYSAGGGEGSSFGLVVCRGDKIIIFGTDSTMVRITVRWFIDNVLSNPEYASEGKLTVPEDISYSIDGSDLAPSYFIDPDAENSVKIELMAKVLSSGNHMVLQGACADGEYAYVVLENQKVSPSVGIIRKIDLKTWKTVKDSEPLAIDHGNDLAYNSKTGMLIAVHNAPNRNKISIIDPETLTVVETKTLNYEIYSITYNEELDRYALGLSYGFNFVIVDSEFNYVGKKIIIGEDTGFTKQGMDSDDKYIYFVQSWDNCIVVYDWSGTYIKTINFESTIKDESEAIFHIGGSFYITFNIDYKTHGAIYKVDITEEK